MIQDELIIALKRLGIESRTVEIEIPKHEKLGDISTPVAMTLAKELKKPPQQIAKEIIEGIEKNEKFEKIEVSGPGFINFTFKNDFLLNELRRLFSQRESFFKIDIGQGRKIQIEFVSANPTGPLHLGHGRGAALGATLSNLLEKAGYKVEREFYINDAGRQVRLLGESVFARYQDLSGVSYEFPVDGYRGDYVDELTREILNTEGDRFLHKRFEDASGFFVDFAFKKMLKLITEDLNTFGVRFDSWQSEKEIHDKGSVKETIETLRERGFVYAKDGAIWFSAKRFSDEKDRVITKTDGEYTYFASDISYHKMKIDKGFDELINIWGADHHGYIPRIRAVIKALGFDENKLKILLVQMVTLLRSGKPVQMSKRAGEFVTLREVIEEIGADLTKFIFLTRKADSHLDFDLDVAKKESSENPVFYVQYAYARIHSLFKKAEDKGIDTRLAGEIDLKLLCEPEELRMIKKLILYPVILEGSARALEPHRITFYLQELSALFHHYYNKFRILTEEKELTSARLLLCQSVRIVLEEGLTILGISAPERM